MAKQPTFYPNLPRSKSRTLARRVGAISVRTAVKVPRVIQADRSYKPFSFYEPNYLTVNESPTLYHDVRVGIKNPGWKVTIANGGDATSGYSREQYSIKPTQYRVHAEGPTWVSNGYGTLFGGLTIQENDQTALNDQAIGRLKNRLQGKVGNAQLAAPLAESREIHRLVRQINGLGMSTFKALLAGKASKGKSIAKQAGDIWLGFGFGVNPMLKDIQSAADSILHYVTRMDRRVVVSGTANTEYHSGYRDTSSSEYVAQDASIGFHVSATHKQGIRYVAGIDLIVRAGSNYSVTDHLGLELSALPSTLWELTAYSWAVDYFTTVGSWLEDAFYTVPGTVKYVSKNYKYQSETSATPIGFYSVGTKGTLSGSTATSRYTSFSRTKLAPTFPVRSLRIKSADEIASHGLTKLLNLASVLAGRHGPKL